MVSSVYSYFCTSFVGGGGGALRKGHCITSAYTKIYYNAGGVLTYKIVPTGKCCKFVPTR